MTSLGVGPSHARSIGSHAIGASTLTASRSTCGPPRWLGGRGGSLARRRLSARHLTWLGLGLGLRLERGDDLVEDEELADALELGLGLGSRSGLGLGLGSGSGSELALGLGLGLGLGLQADQPAALRREEQALLRWISPPEEAWRAKDWRRRIVSPPQRAARCHRVESTVHTAEEDDSGSGAHGRR